MSRRDQPSSTRSWPGGFPDPPSRDAGGDRQRTISLGFSDANLNATGQIMDRHEVIKQREIRGYCPTCHDHPTQLFDIRISRFGIKKWRVPRTDEAGFVRDGVCLKCNPDKAIKKGSSKKSPREEGD
eukprot:CAMPEP_0183293118 /NCGR_PEP_ID=MMETSP0160_2-20130417/1928_1 /TAXON_ID=2839 ORGANISM="Odontella Sinensis, Strain Grunow 1884" /NCGR_SAMPLE_ID=MMETSP0160_2 /ASSEMBLY_ACC=CAM_ASM_000250 /LENGTH=126 /DNA_ID=CAMNT_0025454179 /DNA_START=35 /DNA_END=412 /DNA_ORIENTATION=+